MKLTILLAVLLLKFNWILAQNSREEIEALKNKTYKEIELANKILEETKGRKKESVNDLYLVTHKLERRKEYLKQIELEIIAINKEIETSQNDIKNLEEHILNIKRNYSDMIVNLYKNRGRKYLMFYFFGSENLNQAYKRISYFKMYHKYQQSQIEKVLELTNNLNKKENELKLDLKDKNSALENIEVENKRIIEDINEKNLLIKSLEKRENDISREIREKQNLAKRLESELKNIIEAERKKTASSDIISGLTPSERVLSENFANNKGKLPWPTVEGIITEKYGEHAHPEYKSLIIRNDGINIATVANSEVRAVFNGTVSKVFSIPGENFGVIIKHGEYFTLYHNLINVKVKQGQNVKTGESLGTIFTDPETKESILHFQIWRDNERNDPEVWLGN